MGPSSIRNASTSPAIPEPTPEEQAAGASLIERPPTSSAAVSASAPPPAPPPAVKRLIDAHPSAPAALPPAAKKDWCGSTGSAFVPEGAGGVNWSDACKSHDECYATPGANKLTCDFNLQQDMSLACAAQGGGLLCQVVAEVYRHGVELFGKTAFDSAQNAAKASSP